MKTITAPNLDFLVVIAKIVTVGRCVQKVAGVTHIQPELLFYFTITVIGEVQYSLRFKTRGDAQIVLESLMREIMS